MTASLSSLSVVVPCFNEEGNVERYGEELIKPLSASAEKCEFIFVDDGSTDSTLERLREVKAHYPSISVIAHDQNSGMGSAIRSGIRASTGDVILTMDADLTFHPDHAGLLIDAYCAGQVDVVLGSPIAGRFEKIGKTRLMLSRTVNWLYRVMLGVNVTSTSSLFRLYRGDILRKLNLTSPHFSVNAEIMFKLIRSGARFKEVPVSLSARVWGHSKINVVREIANHVRMFFAILRWRAGL